jgi:hypothetical protein
MDAGENREISSKAPKGNDLEAERQRLRRQLLETSTRFRIRLHISQMDGDGCENDLGPWPEHVAQVSNLEDAMDLCTMLSHHIPGFLFPKERAS